MSLPVPAARAESEARARTFTYAKGKRWHRLVYGASLVCFAVLAVSKSLALGAFASGAWLAVVVLGGLGLIAFRGLFDHRPVLTIGPEGIWFIRWKRKHAIPWAQVQHIALRDGGRGGPLVCVYLPGDDREMRTGAIPPHAFGAALLDVSAPEAAAVATAFWSAATSSLR